MPSSATRSRQATDNKRILIAFGTRPEAIKLCPLINELKERGADVRVLVSSQHKELLFGALDAFGVRPDYDLDVMSTSQSLFDVTVRVLERTNGILERVRPDTVVVHGDTTTAFSVALASFYMDIPTAHVEAGLRTNNIRSPFPEEYNRRAIALTAKHHFAPTQSARKNLLREGIPEGQIFVTGNTVIDAVRATVREEYTHSLLEWAGDRRIIFLTAHRRENLGSLEDMLSAVSRLSSRSDICFIYPVHPNPRVREIAERVLGEYAGVRLCPPLGVADCHNILARSYLVLTDSGGLQEEAAALGVPVLVMRDTTERPEGVDMGAARLVGTDTERIYEGVMCLLDSETAHENMSHRQNPYGERGASKMIADILLKRE